MKKQILLPVIALVLFALFFTGCEKDGREYVNASDAVVERCSTVSAEEMKEIPYKLESCYKYGDQKYVFLFYLGAVENVPLQDSHGQQVYYGGTDYKATLSQSTITTDEVIIGSAAANERCETFSYSTTTDISVELGFEEHIGSSITMDAVVGSTDVTFSQSISTSAAHTNGNSSAFNKSISQSYSEASSSSVQKNVGVEISFDRNSKHGYYRWIYMGRFHCFTYVYVDFNKNEVIIDTVAELNNAYCKLDYSETGDFLNNSTDKLKFDEKYLENLVIPGSVPDLTPPKPEEPPKEPDTAEDILSKNTVFKSENILNNTKNYTINEDGYFGLTERDYDTVDLSSCNDFMSEKYLFCFEVGIDISKKDEGYQEIYLYNNNTQYGGVKDEYSTAVKKGMVCGSVLDKGDDLNTEYIYWYVRGNEIKDKMYIRYDASGKDADTWYKTKIVVNLTIVSSIATEQNAYTNNTAFDVTDNGTLGLGPRDTDSLNIKNFYKNNTLVDGSYAMVFDVSMDYKEKNDGYQEVYLYSSTYSSSGTFTLKDALNKGLLDRYGMDDGSGKNGQHTENFDFCAISVEQPPLNGEIMPARKNDLQDTLYIRYDAHGEDSDTWTRISIVVDYHLFPIPAQSYTTNAIPALDYEVE